VSNRNGEFRDRVVAEVRRLRRGEVVSYGEIALRVGVPNAARAVGRVLASNTEEDLPWWLVVTADGGLVHDLSTEQTLLLREDGIEVIGGRVPRALIVTPR
jgi:methylated-DNA-protein-cysteine methyltransferase related protein